MLWLHWQVHGSTRIRPRKSRRLKALGLYFPQDGFVAGGGITKLPGREQETSQWRKPISANLRQVPCGLVGIGIGITVGFDIDPDTDADFECACLLNDDKSLTL
jgi:hypothetical protein